MGLPDKLVEKLACPKCHTALKHIEKESRLECHSCKVAYRVVGDIPVLEIDEAEKLQ
jgi:hypothetical protein